MDIAPAVETRRERDTPLQRLMRALADFAVGLGRLALLTAFLLPVVLLSILTIDMPVRAFDHFFSTEILRPGLWLSRGQLVMALGPMLIVLIARRYGGEEAARVVTAAWAAAAIAAFVEFAYLAPVIEPGDLPTARFAFAFAASAMTGQYVAAALYDVLRGGGAWWRAPLYALLAGYAAHVVIWFAVGYWTSNAPWLNWMVMDFSLKTAMAFAFLPLYRALRRRLKPRGGYGG